MSSSSFTSVSILVSNSVDEQHNPKLRQIYKSKLEEVISRAEQIKKAVVKGKKPMKVGDDGDDSGEEEKESDKLKDQLLGSIVTNPNVHWDDVAGLEGAKEALKEAVILPTKFPQLFEGERKPWTGILLYGPPGTGKSFIAKACATEAQGVFFSIKAADILSKFLGEAEKNIKNLFELAREKQPAIIFIDEIDSIMGARHEGEHEAMRRVKTEMLIQMQGVGSNNKGVLVLGATNLPWEIDEAARRRFEKRIYISLPDEHSRKEILRYHIGKTPHSLTEENLEECARETDGFSGSDISTLAKDAIMAPLRKCQTATRFKQNPDGTLCPTFPTDPQGFDLRMENMNAEQSTKLVAPPIDMADMSKALTKTKKSVAAEDLQKYEEWTEEFGQEG